MSVCHSYMESRIFPPTGLFPASKASKYLVPGFDARTVRILAQIAGSPNSYSLHVEFLSFIIVSSLKGEVQQNCKWSGGAQRPVLRVNEPKIKDACSERSAARNH
jgi:hypothetical protein